jgi:magnesium-transporting ATPase (P-type)
MSLIIKEEASGKLYLLSKGADNVMLPKIDFTKVLENHLDSGLEPQAKIQQDLLEYSCEGFRTLVYAMRRVSHRELERFERL